MENDIELNKTCRGCLTVSDKLRDVYDIVSADTKFASIFNLLFGQEYFMDTYPKKICDQCFTKVQYIDTFKQNCERSVKAIRQHLDTKLATERLRGPTPTLTLNLALPELNIKSEPLDRDDEEFTLEKNIETKTPIKQEYVDPIMPEYVSVDQLDIGTIPESVDPVQLEDTLEDAPETDPRIDRSKNRLTYQCLECDGRLGSEEELLEHGHWHKMVKTVEVKYGHMKIKQEIKEKPREPKLKVLLKKKRKKHRFPFFSCKYCSRKFPGITALKFHEIKAHTGDLPYRCNTCLKRFAEKSELNEHKLRTHETTECSKCSVSFNTTRELRHHMAEHREPTPRAPKKQRRSLTPLDMAPVQYSCFVCEKVCGPVDDLKLHMEEHDVKAKDVNRWGIKCQRCGLRFSQERAMFWHRKDCLVKHEAEAGTSVKLKVKTEASNG